MLADQVAHPAHLKARDTTLVFVSRAPQAQIQDLKQRMGWQPIPWYTLTDDFDADFGVDAWHGTNAFIRERDQIFGTYFIHDRGNEHLGSTWSYLDITALGRQEEWEDSPDGYPQTALPVVELPRRARHANVTASPHASRSKPSISWREALSRVKARIRHPTHEDRGLEVPDPRRRAVVSLECSSISTDLPFQHVAPIEESILREDIRATIPIFVVNAPPSSIVVGVPLDIGGITIASRVVQGAGNVSIPPVICVAQRARRRSPLSVLIDTLRGS